jgi:hypothetical protein
MCQYSLGEFAGVKGLLEEDGGRAGPGIAGQAFLAVAAGVDDFETVLFGLEDFGQFPSAHAVRQNEIAQEQVNFVFVRGPDFQGGLSGGGIEDFVAVAFEDVAHELEERGFVLDQQQGLGAADDFWRGGRQDGRFAFFVADGEIDLEGGAFLEAAGNLDPTLMLLDNALDGGQPQAGAAPPFLGGEKRLENAAQIFRGDAGPGIAEGEADELAWGGLGMEAGLGRVNMDGGGADQELAAFGHGVAGVDGQVDQNLLQHPRIGLDGWEARGKIHAQGNILAQNAAEHFADLVDDLVQVGHLQMEFVLAAEGQQLARQVAGPPGGLGDFLEGVGRFVARRRIGHEHARMAADDGEKVVEIVGDAAGQLPDGLHFLRLAQLGFQPGLAGQQLLMLLERGAARLFRRLEQGAGLSQFQPGLAGGAPVARQKEGQLPGEDRLQWRFEEKTALGARQFQRQVLLPGIRIAATDDDLHLRIVLPEPGQSLQVVAGGRRSGGRKQQRERTAFRARRGGAIQNLRARAGAHNLKPPRAAGQAVPDLPLQIRGVVHDEDATGLVVVHRSANVAGAEVKFEQAMMIGCGLDVNRNGPCRSRHFGNYCDFLSRILKRLVG